MITAIFAARDVEMPLAHALHALVPAAAEGILREVLVIDGGSSDGTAVVADAAGCDIIESRGERENELRHASEIAKADWLLFLSPHVALESGWQSEAADFIGRASEAGYADRCAAVFRLGQADDSTRARLSEWFASVRTKLLAAPRNEQGLLISRALYRKLGGHRSLPAMSEVDLARRVGRRRLTMLRKRATIRSPMASQERGLTRSLRSGLCLALFVLRLPPALIARLAA